MLEEEVTDDSLTSGKSHSGSLNQRNEGRKRNKRHPFRKEELKLALPADDMIVYLEKARHHQNS